MVCALTEAASHKKVTNPNFKPSRKKFHFKNVNSVMSYRIKKGKLTYDKFVLNRVRNID